MPTFIATANFYSMDLDAQAVQVEAETRQAASDTAREWFEKDGNPVEDMDVLTEEEFESDFGPLEDGMYQKIN